MAVFWTENRECRRIEREGESGGGGGRAQQP